MTRINLLPALLLTFSLFSLQDAVAQQAEAQQADAQQLGAQQEPVYVYRAFDSDFEKRFHIDLLKDVVEPSAGAVASSFDEGWFAINHPDFSSVGPWITKIHVVSPHGNHVLSLIDHASYETSAWWVTDKLVAVRVWWGRLVGSIAIFDIENMSWPYREMFSPTSLIKQLSTAGAPTGLATNLEAGADYIIDVQRGPLEGRPAVMLKFDSESSMLQVRNAPSCQASIDSADINALRQAVTDLLEDRASRAPVCKPGACQSCTLWSVEILSSNSPAEMFSQRSSCLSTDPVFRKLILQIEATAAKHLPSNCFTVHPSLESTKTKK